MYKPTISTFVLLLLFLAANTLHAQSYVAKNGEAEFISNAPMLEFKGTSDHLAGLIDLDRNLVDFYLDLTTLKTGIELRNQHMRSRYLETDKYPYAEFTGELISSFDPDSFTTQQVTAQGSFSVHGTEREITVTGTVTPTEKGIQLDASWSILLADYNIERPSIVFYKLADEQQIDISILLKPKTN